MSKIKILLLASDPFKTNALALDEEIRAITAKIQSSDYRDALELIPALAVRPDDLHQLLLHHKPHVVHSSGHGTRGTSTGDAPPGTLISGRELGEPYMREDEQLVLTSGDRRAEPISKAALVELLKLLPDNVQLVFLNSCRSAPIAVALAEVIPYAIGMTEAITDEAAIAFASAFYEALGFGRTLQGAFDLGRHGLMIGHAREDQTPQLYCREGAKDPTQVVLVVPAPPGGLASGADRNRMAMIEKVRTIWITGFLEKSLFSKGRIILGLSERPDAVTRPMDLLVKRPDEGERPLQTGTQLVDVFDSMDRALLILGEPGSGKTTLLLELARDLLERVTQDPTHPIPVVVPLSTWAKTRKPVVQWLQDELNLRYDVPRKIAKEWVESDQILPLLDGLDEVKAEHLAACVEAINKFRQSHGFLPVAITSRTADYQALAEPLRVHGAILVRPLTREQVNTYLAGLGTAGQLVRDAIHEDQSLWELLDSPLLLNIVTASYAGRTASPALNHGTSVHRRDQLFGLYVDRMLRSHAIDPRYPPEQTVRWLELLAGQMAKHDQTVFYIEQMQLDWLPVTRRRGTSVGAVLISGLVGGIVIAAVAALLTPFFVEVGSRFAIVIWGSVAGLVVGSVAGQAVKSTEIVCVEAVHWSWSHCWRSRSSIRRSLLIGGGCLSVLGVAYLGLGFGLLNGLYNGLLSGLYNGLLGALIGGTVGGLSGGVLGALIGGLFAGLSFTPIEQKANPNEGIRRSARNALFVGFMFGLSSTLFFFLLFSSFSVLDIHNSWSLLSKDLIGFFMIALCFAPLVGLIGALVAGGGACIKHLVLRMSLIANGSIPWNYVRFLDYAADRILLRKVGGGYVFLHRMLLEWFAARYVEPAVGVKLTAKPSSIEQQA
jgi:hypothetical protein